MAIEMKMQLRMSQSLVMTPQLQQAIKLLQLSRMELIENIQTEMLENPVLVEEGMDQSPTDAADAAGEAEASRSDLPASTAAASADGSAEGGLDPKEAAPAEKDPIADIDWESYLDTYSSQPTTGPTVRRSADELPSLEATLTKTPDLTDHLEWQLRLTKIDATSETLGLMIIHNLDDNGYLSDVTCEELAEQAEVEVEQVEDALSLVQHLDPVGVAARDLRECLLIQAKLHHAADEELAQVISVHMSNLERKNYQAIARDMKLPMEEVIEIARTVSELDPKPGRVYSGGDTHYVSADISVVKVGDDYEIVLNEDGLPKLRVSDYYRSALQGSKEKEAKEYIQEKLRSAVWIIRSIHQRQRTIYKVTESIVKFQREFLDKGIAYLKPLILRDVADDIGMHESTVSRVTTNKYVNTPQGLFELKFFFNSGIRRYGSDDIASEAVKDKIKQIVSAEDPKKPFSDQAIVRLLAQKDIHIARRTVAKYREILGILPSSKRKRLF